MAEDVLSWLLPGSAASERAGFRRVITALRLLRDDARVPAARYADPSWWRVRTELERLELRQRRRALEGVLHAYLSALRAPDSFLDLGPRPMEYAAAWRALLSAGEAALLPGPTEAPAAVVARLLAAADACALGPGWRDWWRACAAHIAEPADAERRWETLVRTALDTSARAAGLARLVAGLAAARLERFEPARALALHRDHAELARHDPDLRRILGWSALLCGELPLARAFLRGTGAPAAPLPRALAELRADVPAWAELLPGEDPGASQEPTAAHPRGGERRVFGAVLLAVLARRTTGGLQLVALDASPGLHAEAAFRLDRAGEAAPLLAAGLHRLHRAADATEPLAGALGGLAVRALARVALGDGRGEARAWLQLECPHHLLPSAPRLAALARAWSDVARSAAPERCRIDGCAPAHAASPFAEDDPRGEFVAALFDALSDALGPLDGRRARWIEPDESGTDCVRAERGGGPAGAPGRCVQAARERRAPVRDEDGARVGSALPLVDAGGVRVLGVLVLESTCRAPLSDERLAAAWSALRALAPLWWTTAFRAAQRARDGADLAWDPARRFLSALEPALRSTAGVRTPLVLVGEPGSGRRTLARWLHFRGPRAAEDLCEASSETRTAGRPSTRVLELEDLGHEAQVELARTLAAGTGERFLFLARAPVHLFRERRALARELERVLDPLPLVVPPLRERRDELPALIGVLAANVARREARPAACFEDDAVAALWRQDWRGGVAELAALVAQLARAHAGERVGANEVRAAFCSRRLAFRERVASRRPRPLDVADALTVTRHGVGTENRSRAARYLGWDPDTLGARLDELVRPGLVRPSQRRKGAAGEGNG